MKKEFINPNGLAAPIGFTHVVKTTCLGSIIFVSGQVAKDSEGNIVGKGNIEKQFRQVYKNIKIALESAGATVKDIIKWNTYMVDITSGIDAYRKIRAEILSGATNYPASTLVEVKRLAHHDYLVEIEIIAAIE